MPLLAAAAYDPAVAVSKATSSRLAMTALDTTNLRLTFTAPASGNVLVRLKGQVLGASTFPRILLGVLDGATLRGRMTPYGQPVQGVATTMCGQEASYIVTGLTPGNSFTWDAAYGVDILVTSTNLKYGGPNDAAGADAFGAFVFEVWSCPNLLAGTLYDPTTAATNTTTALTALTALDTTNLRLTFTAPASGKVFWRVRTQYHGSNTIGQQLIGVLESTTVIARQAPTECITGLVATGTNVVALEASGVVTGLATGSHTWDAAAAVQVISGANGIVHGGPDDTTTDNCFGGTAFEIWTAA